MLGLLRKLLHRENLTGHRLFPRPRLEVELLDERVMPTVSFAPVAAFAVNPAPLPPVALVQFAPVVQLPNVPPPLDAPTFQVPVQISGISTQTLSSPDSAVGAWSLSLAYNLRGSVSESWTPPGSDQPPGYTATFNLTGVIRETLYRTNSAGGWRIAAIISENGTASMNASAANPVANLFAVNASVNLRQTETNFYPPGILPPISVPWLVKAQMALTGSVIESLGPVATGIGTTTVAAFSLQDQIAESLSMLTGATPPPPVTMIAGQFSANGSATVTVIPPLTADSAGVFVGTVQYSGKLSETISNPISASAPITLTQEYNSLGKFLEFEFGLLPSLLGKSPKL